MYYRSNHYSSNHYRSNYFDGSGGLSFESELYFDKLGELGFTGALPDRQKSYLMSLGYSGAMNDCMREHLRGLGYSQGVQEMLAEKSRLEGFLSVSEMWIKQGLIPRN